MLNCLPDGHPMKEKKISYIKSREEWKKHWDETSNVEELISLLHFGLDIPGSGRHGEWAEHIVFYLSIAHGYQNQSNWIDSVECNGICHYWKTAVDPGQSDPSYVRQQVARKAWKMLCTKIFGPLVAKPLTEIEVARKWLSYLEDDAIVSAFIGFFSEVANIPHRFSSLDHDISVVMGFLKIFVTVGWGYDHIMARVSYFDASNLDRFAHHRPKLLKIIDRLRLWDEVFIDDQLRWKRLSDADLEKIDQLIKEHWTSYSGTKEEPYSLEAAAFQGWKNARFLLLARLLKKEESRQVELQEARRQKGKAERRLKEISSRK